MRANFSLLCHHFRRFVSNHSISCEKMKFSANISTQFSDLETLQQRYEYVVFKCPVKFEAIECQDPYQVSTDSWRSLFQSCQQRGVTNLPKWDLINSQPMFNHFNQLPTFDDYKTILEKTLEYAKFLGCRKVHLIMGDIPNQDATDQQEQQKYQANLEKIIELLGKAAKYLGEEKIACVIEPLSIRDNYYLRSYKLAKKIVKQVNQDNLKVMLDIYHLQRLDGNITDNVKSLIPVTGHVQISQVPLRDGPFNDGEVNYDYVLRLLSPLYHDYVGLEYKNSTRDSLGWIGNYVK